ncbi:cobalamin-dependent protein [Natranaerobius trueperi]|nr:cobalamin-dependent protein [Natranaerobius trueperi]
MSFFSIPLKELRKLHNISQTYLANQLGLSQTSIGNYEKGIRFPNQQVLAQLTDYFQVSYDYLLGNDDSTNQRSKSHIEFSSDGLKFLEFLLHRKQEKAKELVLNIASSKENIQKIFFNILLPTIKEAGDMWGRHELELYNVYYISSVTKEIIYKLQPYVFHYSKDKRDKTLLAISYTCEQHDIGIRVFCELMRLKGWEIYFIEGDLPASEYTNMIKEFHIDLVIITATMQFNITTVEAIVKRIKDNTQVKVLVGGPAFNTNWKLWKQVNADSCAADLHSAIKLANRLVN